MRLLIYLLAMLTGFSAAEAARPVTAVPASVDAAVGQAYAAVAVKAAEQGQSSSVSKASYSSAALADMIVRKTVTAPLAATPVQRHDLILA